MEEKIIRSQLIKIELIPLRAEFFKRCCQYEEEIKKLLECEFFDYDTGEVAINKAGRKIRIINLQKKWKWNK